MRPRLTETSAMMAADSRSRKSGQPWSASALSGFSPANSNTRISASRLPLRADAAAPSLRAPGNLGLNSERQRAAMVERLRRQGIADERVLRAMQAVLRHSFVDEALASRAYDDAALPIGFAQTISQPWVVAHMIQTVLRDRMPRKILEIGAGCGYQAAVLAHCAPEVHSIERIQGLYDLARNNFQKLKIASIKLHYGDGMRGLPDAAPFDAIVIAAAGLEIPAGLRLQLAVGGRLIAPEGGEEQRLVLIERTGAQDWTRIELEPVRFVPLKAGTQT